MFLGALAADGAILPEIVRVGQSGPAHVDERAIEGVAVVKRVSRKRTTLLPSALTSGLPIFHVAAPFGLARHDAAAGVNPLRPRVLVEILALTLASGLPSILTVSAPSAMSLSIAMFGYGIGIGPPGLGVLQTSGGAHVRPPVPLVNDAAAVGVDCLSHDWTLESLLERYRAGCQDCRRPAMIAAPTSPVSDSL